MMRFIISFCAFLFLYPWCSLATPPKPRQIPFSTTSYGPDGPWQAVSIGLGTPSQWIDLYPGGFWQSKVLNTSVCSNTTLTPTCYNPAGLFGSQASSTFTIHPETGGPTKITSDPYRPGMINLGHYNVAFDSLNLNATQETIPLSVPSLDMLFLDEAYQQLPDGTLYAVEVGNLALGCPDYNQTWAQHNGPNINGTQLPNYLHTIGQTTSSSYGLHIGSATMRIPGSLWVGGYDQSRVMGPVSSQVYASDWLPIDLLDIGFGVAEGQSPFSFGTKSGYLARNNDSIGLALQVQVDPTIPYLNLPQSTCDAIAADLPIKFDSRTGLYLWQTDDPMYSKIISSPSLLKFTFRLNSSTSENITINLPFSLLNLTLTAPIVDQPTQYFPCKASHIDSYYLGRAFCQGAFIGVNWMESTSHNGVWWLAQAPGPNTPSVPTEIYIQEFDRAISSTSNTWLESWRSAWTPIGSVAGNTSGTSTEGSGRGSTSTDGASSATSTNNPATGSPGTGLSMGAIAGVGTGIAIAVLGAILVAFLVIRRCLRKESALRPTSESGDEFCWDDDKGRAGFGPREMEGRETKDPVEIGIPRRMLKGRMSRSRYELGDTQQPAELYG